MLKIEWQEEQMVQTMQWGRTTTVVRRRTSDERFTMIRMAVESAWFLFDRKIGNVDASRIHNQADAEEKIIAILRSECPLYDVAELVQECSNGND